MENMTVCEICHNPIDPDYRYCPECRENVAGARICETCQGEGEIDELDRSKINCRTISPPYHRVSCEDCHGEGIIIL